MSCGCFLETRLITAGPDLSERCVETHESATRKICFHVCFRGRSPARDNFSNFGVDELREFRFGDFVLVLNPSNEFEMWTWFVPHRCRSSVALANAHAWRSVPIGAPTARSSSSKII